MAIVVIPELGDSTPNFFKVAKDVTVNGLLLQRPVEALSDAVGLWLRHEGEALVDPPELDLLEEIVGSVLRAMIHAQFQALAGIDAGGAELGLQSLSDRLQGREAVADLHGMDADATGIEVINSGEHPQTCMEWGFLLVGPPRVELGTNGL